MSGIPPTPQLPPKKPGDLERIIAIPKKPTGPIPDITDRFRVPGGTYTLTQIQCEALIQAVLARGGIFPMPVGSGKTLTSALLPRVLGSKCAVILLPPQMIQPFHEEAAKMSRHFMLSSVIKLIPYSRLQVASGQRLLDQYRPDLIIADEAHMLANPTSTRTQRVRKYLAANPNTIFVALSGTITAKKLSDFAHLVEMALRQNAPVPHDFHVKQAWGACLDSGSTPTGMDLAVTKPFTEAMLGPGEHSQKRFREAFRLRFNQSIGIVSAPEKSVGASLILVRRMIEVPPEVTEAVQRLKTKWESPDGEEAVDTQMRFAAIGKQISQGFYYRWKWETWQGKDREGWLRARRAWHSQIRRTLGANFDKIDSALFVERACADGTMPDREVMSAWRNWQAFRVWKEPDIEPVWLSPYLIDDAVEWAHKRNAEGSPAVLWYSLTALEPELRKRGIPVFGRDTQLPKTPITIAASILAHGTGKNMQQWHRALVLDPPAGGKAWEQLLGRLHRTGQEADEVSYTWYGHTEAYQKAMDKACTDSEYVIESVGGKRRLEYCTWLGENDYNYKAD